MNRSAAHALFAMYETGHPHPICHVVATSEAAALELSEADDTFRAERCAPGTLCGREECPAMNGEPELGCFCGECEGAA